jgi:protein arginine N-methyltransferase 2
MDDPAFATPEVDINTQTILLHASNHDLDALKPFLRIPGNASVQDPETGYTPLHAAIAACGESPTSKTTSGAGEGQAQKEEEPVDIEKAKAVVRELFLSGAIWNDLSNEGEDGKGETPGCLAWRLGQKELYELCVDAGVRAEMLLGLMGGYESLGSDDGEEDEEIGEGEEAIAVKEGDGVANGHTASEEQIIQREDEKQKRDVNSEDYLKSSLKFEDDKLLDEDDNGVMMAWETDIMWRTVDLLLPPTSPDSASPAEEKRILNIGFGMGIIDRMFRNTKPLSHHIIEAHPAVLSKLQSPDSDFGKSWEESAPAGGSYKIHAGRWQEIVQQLLEEGQVFDAIYFDTFGESYSQLKMFFTEFVPGLLDEGGRFGFFNGLGADRRVCYDVYVKVVEFDGLEAGLDVEWTDVEVKELGGEGEGEWKGVRRRYWTLDTYRLPICTFLG